MLTPEQRKEIMSEPRIRELKQALERLGKGKLRGFIVDTIVLTFFPWALLMDLRDFVRGRFERELSWTSALLDTYEIVRELEE